MKAILSLFYTLAYSLGRSSVFISELSPVSGTYYLHNECVSWTNNLFSDTGNQDSSDKYGLSDFHCNKTILKSHEFWPNFSRSAVSFLFGMWNPTCGKMSFIAFLPTGNRSST